MTQSILDFVDMKNTLILYDHYHLKLNLEEKLLSKWKRLKPYIDLLFKVSIEDKLNIIFEKTLEKCEESNHS